MAWELLAINRPHLVYIILGGFTSIFMLCSLFIKEKLYIGEATVATICGIIFGPSAANLINPLVWGNTDQITLEFSRIVLVVQCFAVGVELPKYYMERHWRSMVMLLVPVMTWGWLITSLFIWWMIEPLTWLESLICAACVTATDPVLASSVVGKGKFAKRIPKHLRDVLSAESGCNDGMAFPFIYLSLFLARYRSDADYIAFRWICYIILYECLLGAIYGFVVGYLARHAIKLAERKNLIDRESFLVFYFVLALFCAGSGSMLGMDDLLIGFSAGVGFSNDGWFTEKTEESHVSNVIDLLLNLTYFVYFGTIIPWSEFNAPELGMVPWRLVVLGLFVLLFRRIPGMLAFKPCIPDVGTWREALFAGHFGPIGVGAIFVAILARAELLTQSTNPTEDRPVPGDDVYNVFTLIWPITCFLVILSIAIHGSSIAVFTLGKRINTLTLTLSYTQDVETGRSWMDRLPRISASNSKSASRDEVASVEVNEKSLFSPGAFGPNGVPGTFLRRQTDENEKLRTPPNGRSRRKRKWQPGQGPGGPISDSAITPQRQPKSTAKVDPDNGQDTLVEQGADQGIGLAAQTTYRISVTPKSSTSTSSEEPVSGIHSAKMQAFEEGDKIVVEDPDGNIVSVTDKEDQSAEGKALEIGSQQPELHQAVVEEAGKGKAGTDVEDQAAPPEARKLAVSPRPRTRLYRQFSDWRERNKFKREGENYDADEREKMKAAERKRGPAHAYQFGNNIIVEDEDGEVIRSYNLSNNDAYVRTTEESAGQMWRKMSHAAGKMGGWVGMGGDQGDAPDEGNASPPSAADEATKNAVAASRNRKQSTGRPETKQGLSDDSLRFTISHIDRYGHGLSGTSGTSQAHGIPTQSGRKFAAAEFLKELQQMDPKAQSRAIDRTDAPEPVKVEMRRAAQEQQIGRQSGSRLEPGLAANHESASENEGAVLTLLDSVASRLRDEDTAGKRGSLAEEIDSDAHRRSPSRLESSSISTGQDPDEATNKNGDDQRNVPTYDVASSLAQYRRSGGTAAEKRRQEYSTNHLGTTRSSPSQGSASAAEADQRRDGADDVDEEEVETAAERRRRLGALGVSHEHEESESEDEQDNGMSQSQHDTRSEPRSRMASRSTEPPSRIQWGRVSWKEAADPRNKPESERQGENKVDGGGSIRRAIQGLFGKKA